MPWTKLITFALELWDLVRPTRKVAEPTASQRDIAIGVASSETARQEGKRAARLIIEDGGVTMKGTGMPSSVAFRVSVDEDTWPGERK